MKLALVSAVTLGDWKALNQMTNHLSEQFQVENGTSTLMGKRHYLAGEAQRDTDLSRALIQYVCAVQAAGYEDEILVDGEVWSVEVRRKSPVS